MDEVIKLNISNVCYVIVFGQFADMCNPQNRGSNFSWNKFVERQAEECRIHLHLYIPADEYSHEEFKEFQEFAGMIGFGIASQMVKRAGFI